MSKEDPKVFNSSHAGISKKGTGPGVENNYHQTIDTIERPKDNITWLVIQDLVNRAKVGYQKYNITLQENNHQNMLQHAYEEALDLAQYLKKEINTLNNIQDLITGIPNNEKLGEIIREIYG